MRRFLNWIARRRRLAANDETDLTDAQIVVMWNDGTPVHVAKSATQGTQEISVTWPPKHKRERPA